MPREFSKVAPSLWRLSAFRALGERCQILYLYVITNGHVTSAGCYALPDGYACADLSWQLEPYQQARGALVTAGLVDHDPGYDELFIDRWFVTNPPMNEKHAKGVLRLLSAIQSERLREKALAQFQEADAARVARQMAKSAAGHLLRASAPSGSDALRKCLNGSAGRFHASSR